MAEFSVKCLTAHEEFSRIQDEWEAFVSGYFPSNYSRTYPWLSAWWKTYLDPGRVHFYIQRDHGGKIVAAAPLFTKWEFFGGMPVRMLHIIGNGLGTDDFLLTADAGGFVDGVFRHIARTGWHVARLNRVADISFFGELMATAKELGYGFSVADSVDYLIRLPATYAEYLQSRSRKFRRNLNHAERMLTKIGSVEFVTVDPYKEHARVLEVGEEIAKTSWQYASGLSHFNKRKGGTFYSNLTRSGRGVGGEDFNILLVDGRPVAYLLGCRRERVYYAIDTAYHADFRNVSVGRILFVRIIERLIKEQQVDVIDFEGAGEYKDHYSNASETVKAVTIYRNTFYTSMIQRYKDSRFYEYLKKLVSRKSPSATHQSELNA